MKPLGSKNRLGLFLLPVIITFTLGLLFGGCEPRKEFDYWQYTDWNIPEHEDEHMDMDGGPDGGMETDTDTHTDSESD